MKNIIGTSRFSTLSSNEISDGKVDNQDSNHSKKKIKKSRAKLVSDNLSPLPKPDSKSNRTKTKLIPLSQLNESSAISELTLLQSEIFRHDDLYYNQSQPEITDAVYDKLIRRGLDIIGKFNHLRHLIPKLDTVGYQKSSRFSPFYHSNKMLSLDNVNNKDELEKFISRVVKAISNETAADQESSSNVESNHNNSASKSISFVIEPKIDGLSLALRYSKVDGKLVAAGTRGDGFVGDSNDNTR
jgi:DNA ligase (NAD+)